MNKSNALLRKHQKPLEKYLKAKGVIEICINRPQEIWIETSKGWQKKIDKNLTLSSLKTFARNLATAQHQKFSDTIPILATSLPHYDYRVYVVGGSMVASGFAMSIRITSKRKFKIEDYVFLGNQPDTQPTEIKINLENPRELKKAIEEKKTILVAGGTSSGKTTLLNSLINYIPKETRLISIEDTQELKIQQPNKVQFLKSKTNTDIAKVTYQEIINACMRMRPDRLLFGELDIENTLPFLRIINTGHAGSMATIHADNPKSAIDAIILNAQLSGLKGSTEALKKYAIQAIDIVLHTERVTRQEFKIKAEYCK